MPASPSSLGALAVEPASVRWVVAVLSAAVALAVAVTLYVLPARGEGSAVLPAVNASLNAASACALGVGWVFIRRRQVRRHRAAMLTAFGLSSAFLVTYVIHHAEVGSVPFGGQGWVRAVYFAVLVPHVVLAACILPMALLTIHRGWTNRIDLHRRIARWTLPLWLYVSLSGVAVYWMLYHL